MSSLSVAVCFNLYYKMESSAVVWEEQASVDLNGEMPTICLSPVL